MCTTHVEFIIFVFKQKTAYELRISDWSSDVCSSDLRRGRRGGDDLLRLCRLRRGLDRGRGNQEPATQRADRVDRLAAVLHRLLHSRREIGRASCRERVCQYV